MARNVFFSFHYERDIWRVNQVRNSWLTKPDRETAGYVDAAAFEEVKRKGKKAIEQWIDKQLRGTSVTVVLIGAETSERPYVQYEIERSYEKGNGMLGIYIHNLKDRHGYTDFRGRNPFDNIQIESNFWIDEYFSDIYPTYDWKYDHGYHNLGEWVEDAAIQAGR